MITDKIAELNAEISTVLNSDPDRVSLRFALSENLIVELLQLEFGSIQFWQLSKKSKEIVYARVAKMIFMDNGLDGK